ncbi:MAG: DivIVA domain-containing protein [Bacteroidota bacterium]
MIRPIEIRKQSFRKAFRGYDPEEVHAFLETLSAEWERQLEDHHKLKESYEQVQANYASLKEVETMLHKTLMQAEQSSRNTLENARQKAELNLREAEAKGREIIRRGVDERKRIETEIQQLNERRDQIFQELQSFLDAQMQQLRVFERRELTGQSFMEQTQQAEVTPPPTDDPTNSFLEEVREQASSNGHTGPQDVYEDIADEL